MMKPTVGIVGLGFVGKGCVEGFKDHLVVHTYDINKTTNPSCASLEELVTKAEVIFVAVPTPSLKTGECNTSILNRVVTDIDKIAKEKKLAGIVVVIKSTVPPGTTMGLQLQCHYITICFNPEFLTEANWRNDFLNQDHVILGYPFKETIGHDRHLALDKVDAVYTAALPNAKLIFLRTDEAEFVKYARNCLLALKVSAANELWYLGETMSIEWDNILEAVTADPRIGKSHLKVPGPDGHYGYGGTCFPKDIQSLLYFAKEVNASVPIMEAAWHRNISIDRQERDWEQLKGRSVTE